MRNSSCLAPETFANAAEMVEVSKETLEAAGRRPNEEKKGAMCRERFLENRGQNGISCSFKKETRAMQSFSNANVCL